MTPETIAVVLESLRYTKRTFQNYSYPSYEIKQERIADVERAIDEVRAIRDVAQ